MANHLLSAKATDLLADTGKKECEKYGLMYRLCDLTEKEIAELEGQV